MRSRATRFAVALALLLAGALRLCSATAAKARTAQILAFGDSLTAGFGLPPDQSFPAQLEKRLRADGIDVQVINGGVRRHDRGRRWRGSTGRSPKIPIS